MKSITRTISNRGPDRNASDRESGLCIVGSRAITTIQASHVKVCMGSLPRRPYKVRYTLDPKGRYLVVPGDFSRYPAIREYNGSNVFWRMAVCFLPPGWMDQRVRRTVVRKK